MERSEHFLRDGLSAIVKWHGGDATGCNPQLLLERITALLAAVEAREAGEKCRDCGGTGIERSGVCHCGQIMDGHSVYDNHSAVEMVRVCESCTAALTARLTTAAEVIAAAEKALERAQGYPLSYESVHAEAYGANQLIPSAKRAISEAEDSVREALALIARWKEDNGGK